MKRMWLAWPLILVTSCSDSSFKGASPEVVTPPPAAENIVQEEPKKPDEKPKDDDGAYKQCLLAVGGDVQSVVSVSQGDVDVSKLTPNSVLYLNVQGQARIDLTSAEISSLKGICISAAGQASLSLDLNSTVSALYYYARGEASTTLNFRDQGTLAKLQTDLSGGSRLNLLGENLTCENLKLQKGGAAQVECNGARL